jgi:hypothetical protein
MSFGLFAPGNVTVMVVLFLCALAVAGAIQTILDLSRPYEGVCRKSSKNESITVTGDSGKNPEEDISQ